MIFVSFSNIYAQSEDSESSGGTVFKPTIGMGVGMFTFYGDITKGQKTNHPIVSRVGYDMRVSQTLTPHFDLYFHVLFGKLGANQRSETNNLNFESTIRMGGLGLTYNFHHALPDDRIIDPYISIGIESFEFLSKTDMFDEFGSPYYYWSDGSIRNMDENAADAKQKSKIITRDYTYETDIREQDIDGFGDYSTRSWAIPIGIGANLYTTDRIRFRIGTAYHWTFTDYIDGITDESVGDRKGDAANDKFLYTSFNLNYSLSGVSRSSEFEQDYSGVDFLAIDMGDEDEDGVIDFDDDCPFSPSETTVDERGCPIDTDGDGVPDYIDTEEGTADSLFADANGVGLSDEELEKRWKMYMDSTGAYAEVEKQDYIAEKAPKKNYALRYEGKTEEIPNNVAKMLLEYTNAKSYEEDGKTVFEISDIESLPEAVRKAIELEGQGISGAEIVSTDEEGKTETVTPEEIAEAKAEMERDGSNQQHTVGQELKVDNEGELIYRIQLGAFSRPISKNIYEDYGDVVYIKGDDGLIRYYTGAYSSYKEAASKKMDAIADGFDGAFVVPLKGKTKVPLSQTGEATPVNNKVNIDEDDEVVLPSPDKKGLKFRVQVGAFTREIPIADLEKYMNIGDVEQFKDGDELARYVSGSFATPEEAKAYKEEIINKGFSGVFLVGEYNGKLVTIDEALELYKK